MKEFIWKITDSEMIGRNGGELGPVETDNKEGERNRPTLIILDTELGSYVNLIWFFFVFLIIHGPEVFE